MRPARSQLNDLYGPIDLLSVPPLWPLQQQFLVTYAVPFALQNSFLYNGILVNKITMNKDMVVPFTTAANLLISTGAFQYIHEYNGCFNLRAVRGQTIISAHAYGLAIDFNAATNPLGGPSTMNQAVIDCFEEAGYVWGGGWKRPDPQHFQYLTET